MKNMKYLLLNCFLLLAMAAGAQELTVKRMEVAVGDLTASVHQRLDKNGNPCALVRVMLKDSAPKFEGNVLGDVEQKGLQYMVYMSAGSKFLRIVPSDHFPIMIAFDDFGIRKLEGKVTYELVLTGDNYNNEQPQESAQPEYKTIQVKGVSFNMIKVEGGTFLMGATDRLDSLAQRDEKTVHQVKLSTYYLGETEVTQELWTAVMGKCPSRVKGDNLPVVDISLKDCQKFIAKLSKLAGITFRLPTEAEWEYAARGGQLAHGYLYSGSDDVSEVAWTRENSVGRMHNVGTKQPNELGLYDMTGNAEEMCSDIYGYYEEGLQVNPTGPLEGVDANVNRGGSWMHVGFTVSRRCYNYYGETGANFVGFRLALSE